jgi:hypothetical protein
MNGNEMKSRASLASLNVSNFKFVIMTTSRLDAMDAQRYDLSKRRVSVESRAPIDILLIFSSSLVPPLVLSRKQPLTARRARKSRGHGKIMLSPLTTLPPPPLPTFR